MRRSVRATVLVTTLGTCLGLLPVSPSDAVQATGQWFSDPVWWPLRVESKVDCTMHNPGCPDHHRFWGVDVIPTGQRQGRPMSAAGVFAMGAGVAHIGEAHGKPCGFGGATDFGTWVWVDHGAGVVSKYGHLSVISITDGQHVAAGDRLGTVGNTGDASKLFCDENYLDFQVRRDGITGPSVEFSTRGTGGPDGQLLACAASGAQSWPHDLGTGVDRIDALPKHAVVPAGGGDCLPDAGLTVVPGAVGLKAQAGDDSLTGSWDDVPLGTDAVRVELDRYEPHAQDWVDPAHEQWRDMPATVHWAEFTHLSDRFKYRMRVWFHDAHGWGTHSNWGAGRPE
ncbi:MAG TPA: M23 family metallopeptidase [Sporichthyaceae bacterium]|nr:M23 family metallopeptidase [Sporichthyaceae bacterium]